MPNPNRRLLSWPGFATLGKVLLSTICIIAMTGTAMAIDLPQLDKTRYHTWQEVDAYLEAVASHPKLLPIAKLIPIGYSREGRQLRVLQISLKTMEGKHPDNKPAAFIMGAHHAREHISKEAVLSLIDKIIHSYGKDDIEGEAITYLVNAGTFYLLPWVNPDGGTNEFFHNPEQRKTNYSSDEPQIGAADCDSCGDGFMDEDSPDIQTGDVGVVNRNGNAIIFRGNDIIGRHLQLWYENGDYSAPVTDQRVSRIQPANSPYTFNYEGWDPDGDGTFGPYSGEDFVGGADPNRNYGEPEWGKCDEDRGCSWKSGSQTYAGPEPFSEPETAAVAAFMRSHPNIVSLESLHSGINQIYPPWFLFEDDPGNTTMDQAYTDAVAQYISQETGYEVKYGGPYSVKGDTTGYSYTGSSQNPGFGLDFWPGGLLSFTTEIYGMGSTSGSAEAVKDWFPNHYKQFDTNYPQGMFLAWQDFPWCTTCDPDKMPGSLDYFNYIQYTEYFVFNSEGKCGGQTDPNVFHCDYWGLSSSTDYYADFDIFAYFNPPSAERCYKDWNCDGSALVRTVDKQLKHLMYRLFIAPFIKFNTTETVTNGSSLTLAVENTGFLRSSIMTTARESEDPLTSRYYDYGNIDVSIVYAFGFSVNGSKKANIGWLGGGRKDDPVPRIKAATFDVSGLSKGDFFIAKASSDKTGTVSAIIRVTSADKQCLPGKKCSKQLGLKIAWTDFKDQPKALSAYFMGNTPETAVRYTAARARTRSTIKQEIIRAKQERQAYKRIDGPFELVPGKAKGIVIKKYH
ncbi:MAG: hypothetical protein GY874_09505 [Desulfobacteraceae bacterium]|nr:hypothetical protein [Desulfobacteraceae bacterium]